ncbi:hypothetical protein HMPREF9413_5776 [Paenibacillus sp. HGF7]|nr:hypothetical protein HMPREF9413_5776 [Paenibacillus sp. HGF7]
MGTDFSASNTVKQWSGYKACSQGSDCRRLHFFRGKIGMKRAGRAAFESLISIGKIILQKRRKPY